MIKIPKYVYSLGITKGTQFYVILYFPGHEPES